ncbi:Ig-like domain-containing protein [Pseudomonas sp. R1-1]|uniref:Ig-like domain-containing protein n=1 Tax=Pseudomonas sp. R1-1 TaxID=1602529 RepID=UPI003DA850BB
MDIQSSFFNQLFVLYPVIIQGWVTPVKPDGVADGGIPKALYDSQPQGLECLVDPPNEMQLASWTMAVDDRVDLYINDDPTPVTGKTIAPGEEHQRVRLYVPHGALSQGVNRLWYKVTRVSGNAETSRDLFVLYHLRLPEALDLVIPPDVLRDGVGAERATQGVTFGFTYNNRRQYDTIALSVGDTTFRFDVPDAPAPVNQTLFTDFFQRAGDNPSAVAEFRVFDQLGNAVMSGEKRLDIHLGRLSLLAPTVHGMNGNQFSPTTPEVRVLVPQGSLLPGDELTVKWTGATAIAAGSYTSPPRPVSAGLEIAVPRSVLAYSLGQQVSVTYLIDRDGTTTESPPLLLNILPLPATALTAPKILEADTNNFLDVLALGTNDATIHALLHTLIEAGQPCWLRVEGKTADGSAHDLTLWNGLPAQVNSTWISQGFWPQTLANSYLRQLGHGSQLKIKLKVALNKSNVEADAEVFPERVYTVKAALEMTIDNSLMRLYAVKLLQNYGWGSKEVPGNVETRQPTGGTAPYTYQSDDPAVASVDSNGKVTGLKNGATTIRVSDRSGSTVSFAVDVRAGVRANPKQIPSQSPLLTTQQ